MLPLELGSLLGVTRQALNNLVSGKSGVSPEMAVRLSKAFGSLPETWLGMQTDCDLAEVSRHADDIKVEGLSARLNAAVKAKSYSAPDFRNYCDGEWPASFASA